jgi:peptidoglycan/LPS O-acetylase OafA/YrhL
LIIGLCGLLILGAPLYRAWYRDDEISYECGYLACFDAIAIGCLVALINRHVTLRPGLGRALRIVATIVLVVTYFLGIEGHEVFGFSVIALSTGVLLIRARDAPGNKSRSAPVSLMCFMGRLSYELYLFHGIVLAILRNVIPKGTMPYVYKLPMFALFVTLSVVLAGAVARYYAEPANALLRERLMARRTAQA